MNNYKIVFSDVDGTLLNTDHKVTKLTNNAIKSLQEKNIPFVIVSARSPSGIYSIMNENNFTGPIIAYSGALILDENKKVLYTNGLSKKETLNIIHYAEQKKLDVHWCAYSLDDWIVKDKSSPRVKMEESIVKAQSKQIPLETFDDSRTFNKIMFICNEDEIASIEQQMKEAFPEYSIVKSSRLMLEIMKKGINKGTAVQNLCQIWNVTPEKAIAFGDNFNDMQMLKTVGLGFLMDNAPTVLKKEIPNITSDNNHDGIYNALSKLKVI